MYGTVAWERTRKSRLQNEFYDICGYEEHDCGECCKLSRECNHLCCQSKFFEYASCMGYKIVEKQSNEDREQQLRNQSKQDTASPKLEVQKRKRKTGIKYFTLTTHLP